MGNASFPNSTAAGTIPERKINIHIWPVFLRYQLSRGLNGRVVARKLISMVHFLRGSGSWARADAAGELLTELRSRLTAQIDVLRRLIDISEMKLL